ncbi:hypothetical protein ACROYT_G015234 [Oculina patagonica]
MYAPDPEDCLLLHYEFTGNVKLDQVVCQLNGDENIAHVDDDYQLEISDDIYHQRHSPLVSAKLIVACAFNELRVTDVSRMQLQSAAKTLNVYLKRVRVEIKGHCRMSL